MQVSMRLLGRLPGYLRAAWDTRCLRHLLQKLENLPAHLRLPLLPLLLRLLLLVPLLLTQVRNRLRLPRRRRWPQLLLMLLSGLPGLPQIAHLLRQQQRRVEVVQTVQS